MNYLIFKTKGVLKEKINKEQENIIRLSMSLSMVTVIILAAIDIFLGVETFWGIVLWWVALSFLLPHLFSKLETTVIKYILLFPILFYANISVGAFILLYRNKYPNVCAENAERYLKIKKVLKNGDRHTKIKKLLNKNYDRRGTI